MERRLFYSTPDLRTAQSCQSVVKQLELAEDNFSVMSLSSADLKAKKLPAASYLKTRDVPRSSLRGTAYGFAGGACLIALLELFQPYGFNVEAQYYWIPMAITTCFGLWLGIMTGLAQANHHLLGLGKILKKGGAIVMVDVTEEREAELEAMIARHAPRAKLEKVTEISEHIFDRTG